MIVAAERVDLKASVGAILALWTVGELDLRDRALLGQIDHHALARRDLRVAKRAHRGAVVEVHGHRAQVDEVVHADELELARARVADTDVVIAVARVGADLDERRCTRSGGRREQEGGDE